MVASSDSLWGRVLDTGSITPILTPAFAGGRLFARRGGRGVIQNARTALTPALSLREREL